MQIEQPTEDFAEDSVENVLPSVGETLRQERKRQNLSKNDVADKLHITRHYVAVIESNSFEKLPGAVFAKGYVKSYAEFLNLDPNDLLGLYEAYRSRQLENEKEKTFIQARRRRDKNLPWVILSIVGFVVGFAGLWAYNNFGADESAVSAPETVSSAVEQEFLSEEPAVLTTTISQGPALITPTNIEADTAALRTVIQRVTSTSLNDVVQEGDTNPTVTADFVATLSTLTNETWPSESDGVEEIQDFSTALSESSEPLDHVIEITAVGSDILRISFSGESWIEVNDGAQNQIYRDIRSSGDVLEITGSAPFSILLGDAPFTSLTFNGTEVDISDDIRIDNSARLTVGL